MFIMYHDTSGLILGLHPGNERRHYTAMGLDIKSFVPEAGIKCKDK